MLAETGSQLGEHHLGRLRRETAEAKAQRIIGEELGRLDWKPTELGARPKSDPAKLQTAVHLRRETTLSAKEIAHRLRMGTARSASVRLHEAMSRQAAEAPAQGHLAI